jgi:hypothetical protein
MAEKKRTKTNINLKIDSELWDQLVGLAKFLKVDRMDLVEESLRDRMKKYPKMGKR